VDGGIAGLVGDVDAVGPELEDDDVGYDELVGGVDGDAVAGGDGEVDGGGEGAFPAVAVLEC
jgi:hypothetical protein